MYEPRKHPPLSRRHFVQRLLRHFAGMIAVLACSLLIGMCGYAYFEGLPWVDAFLNAAMLLGGMGPVETPQTEAGKLFAGCYALYSGLVFLVITGIALAPVLHRVLHQFHWESDR